MADQVMKFGVAKKTRKININGVLRGLEIDEKRGVLQLTLS